MIRTYAALAEQNMSRRHGDWLVQDKVQNIADVLAPGPDDYFVLKPEHSGFYESALGILLDHLNARQLILTRGTADERCRANLKIAAEITRYFLRAGARALPMVAPSHVSPGIPAVACSLLCRDSHGQGDLSTCA
jgi:hypothetical protein